MLIEGTDYLYYRSAYHSGGPVTGMKNSEVAVIATRRHLFLVPIQETSLGLGWITVKRHWFGEGDHKLTVPEALAKMLADPALTIDALETRLKELLPAGEHVVELDELASLRVWSKFLRQVRYRPRNRKQTQVLALRGKDNHERFRNFYADALR